MAKLIERSVLLAKNELIYATDPVPTAAADAIPVSEKAVIEFDPAIIERKHPFPSRGKIKPLTGKRYAKISFNFETSVLLSFTL